VIRIPAILFFICALLPESRAQHSAYGKYVLDSLCSQYCFGRGYVNDGVTRAAYFMVNQLDSLGVKPLKAKYFQEFPLTVNTFPERLLLSIDGKNLVPGQDYQVLPESGGGRNKLDVLLVDTNLRDPYNDAKNITLLPAAWLIWHRVAHCSWKPVKS
jgi:aminopeptidase YwaD